MKITPLLNRKQIAVAIQEHPQTIHKRTVNGEIPYYRSGKSIRYDLQEVLEHMRVNPRNG